MKKLSVIILFLVGCVVSDNEVQDTLSKAGFRNISAGEVKLFGCGEGDRYGREFVAVNANGMRVEGVVCCGYFKSCTVRF